MRRVLARAEEQNPRAILYLILAGGALLRFCALSAESLWFDEAYSVWAAQHTVGWHIAYSTQRLFPPLYYLMLHFWLPLGRTEFVVRSLSVLVGLGSIGAIYALAKRLFDTRVGLISALLLTISPLHIWYSQEARMYILVAALGLCSAYFMWLVLQEGKLWHWLAYVLSTAMAMNAHYFGIFLLPFQNAYFLYLLLRRRGRPRLWKHWLASQLAVGVLSVIGLAGIFSSESVYWRGLLDTWHGAPTWRDLVSLMFSYSLGTTTQGALLYWGGLLLFGLCVGCSFFVWRRRRPTVFLDDALIFTLLYLVIPLGTVFGLSQFQSFWVLRYIFPFLPPYCIIVALGIARVPGRALKALVLGAIVLASAWPIVNTYRYEQKENWRAAVQYISAEEGADDLILLVDEDIWLPFEHYYGGSVRRAGISRTVTDRDLVAARIGVLLPHHSRIWLVLSHTDNLASKDYLMSSSCAEILSEKHFTGIEVDLFAVRSD